ncbi:cyclin-T1 isoform X5 [Cinclus cinclus]
MISRNNSSDMNIAGLMSMSTSSTAGAGPALPASADSPGEPSAADPSQADHWHPPAKLDIHRTSESTSAAEHPQQDGAAYPKQNTKNAPSAKVSLKEYRAKHAEELAAQKRQLENMEANVRSQYAYAAQNLLVQQQREREGQQDSNPSPIVLKIPITGPENPERLPGADKGDKALKMRIPAVGGGGERPVPSKQEEIKMRIKGPGPGDRHSSTDESSGKIRDYKEKHKGHSSNHHHHHHNHHSHKHLHAQLGAGPSTVAKRPGDSKHSTQPGATATPHKGYGPLAPTRKRPLPEEPPAMSHEHQPKVGKVSKGPGVPFPYAHLPGAAHLPGHSSDLSQPSKARGTHKSDKGPSGANGHNVSQASDYQDTVNMLHSLLSAQGMQPTQPPAFEFHSYELLNPRASSSSRAATNTDKPRPPPLPSEPPPPLPPLPK